MSRVSLLKLQHADLADERYYGDLSILQRQQKKRLFHAIQFVNGPAGPVRPSIPVALTVTHTDFWREMGLSGKTESTRPPASVWHMCFNRRLRSESRDATAFKRLQTKFCRKKRSREWQTVVTAFWSAVLATIGAAASLFSVASDRTGHGLASCRCGHHSGDDTGRSPRRQRSSRNGRVLPRSCRQTKPYTHDTVGHCGRA